MAQTNTGATVPRSLHLETVERHDRLRQELSRVEDENKKLRRELTAALEAARLAEARLVRAKEEHLLDLTDAIGSMKAVY